MSEQWKPPEDEELPKGVVCIDNLTPEDLISAIAENKILIGPKDALHGELERVGIVLPRKSLAEAAPRDAWTFFVSSKDPKNVATASVQDRVLFIDSKKNAALVDLITKTGTMHDLYNSAKSAGFTNRPQYNKRNENPEYDNFDKYGPMVKPNKLPLYRGSDSENDHRDIKDTHNKNQKTRIYSLFFSCSQ